jgi:hypothetical protein
MICRESAKPMREPLPIIIFGDQSDARLIALKCILLKCGVCNFVPGQLDGCGRCEMADSERAGLFIVSMASINSREMKSISAEARRLAVPVLHL